ncbi:protein of unknown function [Alteromonadaceae bacterium Bs31]|nr:protein of unknown function [Alteromonadaceae bacterium Bs31]
MKKVLLLILLAACAQGCSQVKAWERGNLAKAEMAFSPDPLEDKIRNHVYHSKEASQTVGAGAGGGCGCN